MAEKQPRTTTMNAEGKREARRKRILENSAIRLKKITTLTVEENVLNGQQEAGFERDKLGSRTSNLEFFDQPILKCQTVNKTPIIPEDQRIFNYEPIEPKLHSKNIKYYKMKFSSVTILHIILSQIVLILFYYDLGFLFGNSIVLPFLFSVIPELYTSKEQHDSSIHIVVLLMMGFSQHFSKKISRCFKLAFVTGKRFSIYIFCFTCSYVLLTNVCFDVKYNSSIT